MATSTVFDFGGWLCFSTTTVRTPFSHLAVIADTLAFSGKRNFLSIFWGALLSSLRYLQPSSSPSWRFLFPLLFITSVFSSSTVTCNTSTLHEHKTTLQSFNKVSVLQNQCTWISDLERPGKSMKNIYSLGVSKMSTGTLVEVFLLSWLSWILGVSWRLNRLFTTPLKSMSNKLIFKFSLHAVEWNLCWIVCVWLVKSFYFWVYIDIEND